MSHNPFAKVFKDAFEADVLDSAIYTAAQTHRHEPRVKSFLDEFNRFLRSSGQAPILYQKYVLNERKLFEYALFLRGYMRDAQNVIKNLTPQQALDEHLISLFEASSNYVVACNDKIGDKRHFNNEAGYRTWKIDISAGLQKARYYPVDKQADIPGNEKRHNLYLFMPFRLKDDEKNLNKWMYKNMQRTLDNNEAIANDVDTYVVFYPIQKSRSANVTSLLKTLKNSGEFYEAEDMQFVKDNWLRFVAKDIKLNEKDEVIAAEPYSLEELQANFRNITIFSYCAGTANAHRSLNALQQLTTQVYGEENAKKAMENVYVISYGFLPPQEKLHYSGTHFYTNAIEDKNRKEPFVNLNNHVLYEKTKCRGQDGAARMSVMPDGRNYVIALPLPEESVYFNESRLESFKDGEFGHSLININTPHINSKDNYSHHIFKSVLQNSSLGKRGKDVIRTDGKSPNLALLNSAIIGRRQYL